MADYGSLPFDEAIQFFRGKVNLPTRAWLDIQKGMHARAFVVAGAMQTRLLEDFRAAVDSAIAKGTTLAAFRQQFERIVKRHGWSYNGAAGWRSRVIYDTNLRTAYQAGRYKQLTEPQALKARPYWRYKHDDLVLRPRQHHLAWNGLVLKADDPFWATHYPPNGWGCKCKVFAESAASLKRKKLSVSKSPKIPKVRQKLGNRIVRVPEGIDPGWDYNVGEAAWGRFLADKAFKDYQGSAWTPLTRGGPADYGRPALLAPTQTNAKPGERLDSPGAAVKILKDLLQSEDKVFELKRGQFRYPIHVNAEILGRHIKPDRSPFLPYLPELLTRPQEAWLSFQRHKTTGKVALRLTLIRVIQDAKKSKGISFIANAHAGHLESWTFIPISKPAALEKQRRGILIFTDED